MSSSEAPPRDSFGLLVLGFLALAVPAVFNVFLLYSALFGLVVDGEEYRRWEAEFRQIIFPATGLLVGFSALVVGLRAALRLPPRGPLFWGSVANALFPLLLTVAYLALR